MGSRMRISTVVKARTIQTRFPGKLVEEPEGVCRRWDALALPELHGGDLAALVFDRLLDLVQAGLQGLQRFLGHLRLGLDRLEGHVPGLAERREAGEALAEHGRCCWWTGRDRWPELESTSWLQKNNK